MYKPSTTSTLIFMALSMGPPAAPDPKYWMWGTLPYICFILAIYRWTARGGVGMMDWIHAFIFLSFVCSTHLTFLYIWVAVWATVNHSVFELWTFTTMPTFTRRKDRAKRNIKIKRSNRRFTTYSCSKCLDEHCTNKHNCGKKWLI